jgi:hypothetical protein
MLLKAAKNNQISVTDQDDKKGKQDQGLRFIIIIIIFPLPGVSFFKFFFYHQ